jgi:hypothetical protein
MSPERSESRNCRLYPDPQNDMVGGINTRSEKCEAYQAAAKDVVSDIPSRRLSRRGWARWGQLPPQFLHFYHRVRASNLPRLDLDELRILLSVVRQWRPLHHRQQAVLKGRYRGVEMDLSFMVLRALWLCLCRTSLCQNAIASKLKVCLVKHWRRGIGWCRFT